MTRQPVMSSNIAAIGYNPAESVLEIEFKAGRLYRYGSVPADIYESLLHAPSVGRYFEVYIRGKFPYTEVRAEVVKPDEHH